ncbi:MAG TPA: hypothetical protein VK557_07160 [Pyrinomonadaceae bacterium]|nr:hypothetical protein [Pyrinomonadaceae bacterium]
MFDRVKEYTLNLTAQRWVTAAAYQDPNAKRGLQSKGNRGAGLI